MSTPTQIKPSRNVWTPHRLEEPFRSIARGLGLLAPLTEGNGEPVDYTRRYGTATAINGPGDKWHPTPQGLGWRIAGAGADRFEFESDDPNDPGLYFHVVEGSSLLSVHYNWSTDNARNYWGISGAARDSTLRRLDDTTIRLSINNREFDVLNMPDLDRTGMQVFCLTGGGYLGNRGWSLTWNIRGQTGSASGLFGIAMDPDPTPPHVFKAGVAPNNAARLDHDFVFVAKWNRALSTEEARAVVADPWGLLRITPSTISAPTEFKGSAILQGVGTVTADGQTSAAGAATLTGTGTLTADGTIGIPTGQAALTGTGILVADGTAIVPIIGEAILQGVGILTAQSLPPLSILSIRQLLAEGIRQSLHLAGRDDVAVYEYPPETVVVPSVVIMPDEPYWVPSNFGRSPLERIRVNLELQMLTPRLEVSESFNDLERLGGIVLQGTLRVPVVQWTELGQPEGVTVNDIETIMTRASVMAHV